MKDVAGGTAPMISVVIPHYNGAAYLPQALEQVRRQTFHNVEVIVVDDGSSADQAAEAARLCAEAGAQLILQNNQGPGIARNQGVAAARGSFVAFLDVDDLWAPDKLQRQVDVLVGDPSLDVIMHDTSTLEDTGAVRSTNRYSSRSVDELLRRCLRGDVNSFTSSLFIRRQWFQEVGGFPPELRFTEDHFLLVRALKASRFHCVPEVLSKRLLHGDSMSSHRRFPDPSIHLERTAKFVAQLAKIYPDIPRRPLLAHARHRVARHEIVLGRRGRAFGHLLKAQTITPLDPEGLKLMAALLISAVSPGKFDAWHPGLAAVRKAGKHAKT